MPVPPTLTAASERRGSLLTVPRHSGMILGRGWPGDAQTPRAVAPPAGTGDAVVLYYSQTRSRQEAGLLHFKGHERRQS